MVRTYILSGEQREAIIKYIDERPSLMPSMVRQMRTRAKRLDYKQVRIDLGLLEQLKGLDLQIGRKSLNYADQIAKFQIRRRDESAIKATVRINPSP